MGIFESVTGKIGGLFGLGGGQGDYYKGGSVGSQADDKLRSILNMGENRGAQDLASRINQGGMSLADIFAGARGVGGDKETPGALAYLASQPITGSTIASQQVIDDPLLAGYFGKDGTQQRALSEEQNLASRGYSLQPEDYEAYGQGSGNIARLFGTQEASLAQALADRGLGSAPSGAAQQGFSNLYGNKFEQLGQLQRQIADDRMKTNMQRLNDTRSYINQLGNLGQNAQQQKYNQNQTYQQNLQAQKASDINKAQVENQAAQASMTSMAANRKASLGDAVSSGIYQGVRGGTSGLISGGIGGMFDNSGDDSDVSSGESNPYSSASLQSAFNKYKAGR